ncbi:MAG TPA: hypothetical protein VEX86_24585, partial [Longimicrobium sp.]|nr:hypothetical protein [Longimicrobium sp.]
MHFFRRYPGRTAALVAGLALAAACTDRSNPAAPPVGGGGPGGGGVTPGKPIAIAVVACTGDLPSRTVSCDGQAPTSGADGLSHLVVGNQNVYVKLTSSNANYDLPTQTLTFDVTVRNLIPQPLGTTNGVALDPAGVRVFFHSGPTVTSGTGTVTVVPDG